MIIKNLKRKLVVFKFTLIRGYAWCQLPAMATMGAGILYPYVRDYIPWIKFWQLALMAIVVFIFVGWLDRKFKLLHEEQNYSTETNPMLMAGLFPERFKKPEIFNKDNEQDKPKDI